MRRCHNGLGSIARPRYRCFERNLKALASKVQAAALLAHVRGVAYSTKVNISLQNTRPFTFEGSTLALAHNGDLYRFADIREHLVGSLPARWRKQICGTTDSEWIAAVVVARLSDPMNITALALRSAVKEALEMIGQARRRAGITVASSVNLFMTNGHVVLATRYCYDFGRYRTEDPSRVNQANLRYLSLWYTVGRDFGLHHGEWRMVGAEESADAILIASEPLTRDSSSWIEVPEYGLLCVERSATGHTLTTGEIRL